MEYIDPYNFPELAIRDYDVNSGIVTPNLFHGTIFRIQSDESFTLDRLKNQIEGAKFFVEIYNSSDNIIVVDFNDDYKPVDGKVLGAVNVASGRALVLEIICRIGVLLVYDRVGLSEEGDEYLYDDGIDYFRLQVRDGALYLDEAITLTGFGTGSVENVDWDSIWSKAIP